jgi:hypothetical protein
MTAEVNGEAWASLRESLFYRDGHLSISGFGAAGGLSLGNGNVPGPGTYSLSYRNDQGLSGTFSNAAGHSWHTGLPPGGTGTLTITTLTQIRAVGIFSFEAPPAPGGASGTMRVTNGRFDVTTPGAVAAPAPAGPLPPGPALGAPPAPGAGSGAFTAEVGGKPWSSSRHLVSYQNQFLGITGFDTAGSAITFGLGQVAGPGTYSLDYLNVNGSSAIMANSSGQGWNTFMPGGTGSITIETLTAHRVAGTFSFGAAATTGGAAGTLNVASGKFDLTY